MGTNAEKLLGVCIGDINKIPPLLYGQRRINGLPQRGPYSFDCIGKVRDWFLRAAPYLWPTSWGGSDCWTVDCYVRAIKATKWLQLSTDTPAPGDTLVWVDTRNYPQHIGIADGKGNVFSALNTTKNICVVPIDEVSWPKVYTIHNHLEQDMMPFTGVVFLMTSDGKAATDMSEVGSTLRLINGDSTLYVPTKISYPIIAIVQSAPGRWANETAYMINDEGIIRYLLVRNGVMS